MIDRFGLEVLAASEAHEEPETRARKGNVSGVRARWPFYLENGIASWRVATAVTALKRSSCSAVALATLACGSPKALFLHPSAEVNIPWGNRVTYEAQGTTFGSVSAVPQSAPRLVTIGKRPTGTLGAVPIGVNLGVMLQFDKTQDGHVEGACRAPGDKTEKPSCPGGNQTSPSATSGSSHNIYLNAILRQYDAELSTQPGNEAEIKVADLGFREYALKASFLGMNIDKPGFGAMLSLLVGYTSPRVSTNHNVLPELAVKGSLSYAVGCDLYYDIEDWLYLYAPIAFGVAPRLGMTTGSVTYEKSSSISGYFPTYAGVGLGVGFRIPLLRL